MRTFLTASALLLLFTIFAPSPTTSVPVHADDPATRCPDFTSDGVVSSADIGLVVRQFGFTEGSAHWYPKFDLDSNGFVGMIEISLTVAQFGAACLDNGKSIPFETIVLFGAGRIAQYPPALRVARDDDEWQLLWDEYWAFFSSSPEPLPPVDFDDEIIVGLFGVYGIAAQTLTIDAIVGGKKEWVIQATHVGLGTGCLAALPITYPHHIVRVQRTDLPLRLSLEETRPSCIK